MISKNKNEEIAGAPKNCKMRNRPVNMISQAKNNPYSLNRLFALFFCKIHPMENTKNAKHKSNGTIHRYHNHIA
jgi:hypothetical protein